MKRTNNVRKLGTFNSKYLRQTYKRLFFEFLKESGIHGLRILLAQPKWRYARILWTLLIIGIFIITHIIIINLVINYLQQPTEVRMSTNLVHVAESPFPGVAICSPSKFSRAKLLKFAEEVYDAQQRFHPGLLAHNVNEMMEHLQLFGGLYVYPFDNYDNNDPRLEKLHDILLFMSNSSRYSTRTTLRTLAPDCESMVLRGLVFGQRVNTSRYFYKRLIGPSVCCMFNYRRESFTASGTENEFIKHIDNVTFESNSILNSVQFVLQSDPDDATFTELVNNAFKLYIFPQDDFAPMQSDTLGEVFVNLNTILEIPVQPIFFDSSESIRQVPPASRHCYFPDEGKKLLNSSYYSLDECLLDCRIDSMLKYCGCVYPPMGAARPNLPKCHLLHLPCLTQWKSLWNDWRYFDYVEQSEDDKTRTSTFSVCPLCLPSCKGVEYKIYVNYKRLRKAEANSTYTYGMLKGLNNIKPLAIVKLYFKQRYAQSTRTELVGDWVQLLSRFGGIMSLMYGFSILSYVEILYYLTGKWWFYICKAWQRKAAQGKRTIASRQKKGGVPAISKHDEDLFKYPLYWNELQPKIVK